MNRKKDIFELISYGLLSAMFACAFFFGLMYPQYGLPYGTYRMTDPIESCKQINEFYENDWYQKNACETRKNSCKTRKSVEYKSYVWECLKSK